jgi:hypothetical protein
MDASMMLLLMSDKDDEKIDERQSPEVFWISSTAPMPRKKYWGEIPPLYF